MNAPKKTRSNKAVSGKSAGPPHTAPLDLRDVRDPGTLKAMAAVDRAHFVPPTLAAHATDDRALPIGHGQTISQPYIVAFMTELAQLKPHHHVLEIGTGSGYQAAVLAEMVATVTTVEIVEALARSAAERLARLGYRNVKVIHADGYHGCPEAAPFDAVLVTAAAEQIPPPLVEQLNEGGRLVIPVGPQHQVQSLQLLEKHAGELHTREMLPVQFVPFTRASSP